MRSPDIKSNPTVDEVLAHCEQSRVAGRCSPPWRPFDVPHSNHRFCVAFAASAPCWYPDGRHLRFHFLAIVASIEPSRFGVQAGELTPVAENRLVARVSSEKEHAMYRKPYIVAIELPPDWVPTEASYETLDTFVESLIWGHVEAQLREKYGNSVAVRVWGQPIEELTT